MKLRRTPLMTTLAATLISLPAFAWHPIKIVNNTDPRTITKVVFRSPGFPPERFPLDIPNGSFGVFGPVHEDGGPCVRDLFIHLYSDVDGNQVVPPASSPVKFDVCKETTIIVSCGGGSGPIGSCKVVISHY